MVCENGCERIVHISAKCDDRFYARQGEMEVNDYVPFNLGIGGGDYVKFCYCLDCGQIQNWKADPSNLSEDEE